jgi:hypothetical protein
MKVSRFDAAPDVPKPSPSSFAGVVAGARVFVDVAVPRTAIVGKMRILSRSERLGVRVEAREYLERLGITGPAVEASTEWHEEIATRTVAVAMRDPSNLDDTLASLEAWNTCDEGQIDHVWQAYKDLQDRLDPLDEASRLSDEQFAAILQDAKKKDLGLLMSYGSSKLAGFAISTAARLST